MLFCKFIRKGIRLNSALYLSNEFAKGKDIEEARKVFVFFCFYHWLLSPEEGCRLNAPVSYFQDMKTIRESFCQNCSPLRCSRSGLLYWVRRKDRHGLAVSSLDFNSGLSEFYCVAHIIKVN